MIKKLTNKDKEIILEFCYKNENENLFTIGNFNTQKNSNKFNKYYGYFENQKLKGLISYFGKYKNLVINAETDEIIKKLIDHAIKENLEIKNITNFEKYAKIMIERLKNTHSIKTKKISEQTVYILDEKNFKNFAKGDEKIATTKDIEKIAKLSKKEETNEENPIITKEDLLKINVNTEFILEINNEIISKANIHGVSKNYFQIGGVITDPNHRKKGYAKRIVSYLCQYYFEKGIKYGLLFTGNDNIAAQTVYKQIGFKAFDKYIIADF